MICRCPGFAVIPMALRPAIPRIGIYQVALLTHIPAAGIEALGNKVGAVTTATLTRAEVRPRRIARPRHRPLRAVAGRSYAIIIKWHRGRPLESPCPLKSMPLLARLIHDERVE